MNLSSQEVEFLNRSEVIPAFVRSGFTPFIPEWDSGIDFIAYRERDNALIKIQLKSRWAIDKKYIDRNIAICFPSNSYVNRDWYLCKHDEMVKWTGESTNYLNSQSWLEKGIYNLPRMSQAVTEQMQRFKISLNASNEELFKLVGSTQ